MNGKGISRDKIRQVQDLLGLGSYDVTEITITNERVRAITYLPGNMPADADRLYREGHQTAGDIPRMIQFDIYTPEDYVVPDKTRFWAVQEAENSTAGVDAWFVSQPRPIR